uniref:gamma-tubulin complex component 2-like n=1 Tax=Styela clava TaxID=7725 RepID=UPI00193AC9DD|nr:gamma-tubulin complex component 2-like [Styela clava]
MSEEFRIHHNVNQLLQLLKVDKGKAEEHTETLLKSRTPFVTTQVNTHSSAVKICEKASKPKEFLQKYEELKSKNVRNLDSMIHFLSNLNNKPSLHATLTKNAEERGEAAKMIPISPSSILGTSNITLPPSGSKLTPKEISELRSTLEKATGPSSALGLIPSAESFRKTLREQHNARRPRQHPIPSSSYWLAGDNSRKYLTADFVYDSSTQHPSVPVNDFSVQMQEQEIVKDVIAILSGFEAIYILVRPPEDKYGSRRFILDPSMDVSLSEMVKLLLPIASSHSIVTKFIEEKSRFEYGQVNHALTAAMKAIIREHRSSLAQLDDLCRNENLTLQRLLFLLQPTLAQMSKLAEIATAIDKGHCIGGSVLSLLHNKTLSSIGNKVAEQLCSYLTQVASVPYLEMLEKWIYRGQINDPYGEFMVEENKKISKEKLQEEYNDQYWEMRYTLCRDRIPVFLLQSAEKILSTGKYLNVVRECGKQVHCPGAREIVYNMNKKEYVQQIEEAHNYASQLLLDLLMQEHNLKWRLKSVKRYFLLNEGDFLLHFMDLTEDEMKMPMGDIMPTRLEALLELALRMSTANQDQYKDDLRIVLLNYDLITQLVRILSIDTNEESTIKALGPTELNLSGLESFAFDYTVRWPWSLVISKKSLTKYQMLFRHLFYIKHVERQLSSVWMAYKNTKRENVYSKPWFMEACMIRQRMYHFIYSFQYYMMFEVLEPNWYTLESNLETAHNVDEVLDFHNDFLQQCLKDCLLTNTQLLKILSKLLMLCVSFCNFMQSLNRQLDSKMLKESLEHSTLSGPPTKSEVKFQQQQVATTSKEVSSHLDELISNEEYQGIVRTFEKNFTEKFLELLDRVSFISREQGQHVMYNIIYRLDFNGYYMNKLQQSSVTNSSTGNN